MPEKMMFVLMAICARCGHKWHARNGKPLRCAACKSPYWDRPRRGRKARPRPPELAEAASPNGETLSAAQAHDIFQTWSAGRDWLAITILDDVGVAYWGGFLRDMEVDWAKVMDNDNCLSLYLKLPSEAIFVYRAEAEDGVTAPYQTLSIKCNGSTAKIGAFHRKPERGDLVRI